MESKKIVIKDGAKKPGKVKTFFYNLFVKNIGYKANLVLSTNNQFNIYA